MTLDLAWRIATLVAGFTFLGVPQVTSAAQTKPPQALLDAVGRLDRACVAAGGRPARGAFLIAQDFTGDGVPDYLVNEGNYDCFGRPNLFVENGQAHVEIYVADRSGGALKYRENLLAVRVLDGRPQRVQVAQRGTSCGPGSTAATECGGTLVWNARTNAFDLELTGVRASPRAPMQRPVHATIAMAGAVPGSREDRAPAADARTSGTARKPGAMPVLPIEFGFYVSEGTRCSEASNATLQLIGRKYMSSGGKVGCDFTSVKPRGGGAFEVDMSCNALVENVDYDSHALFEVANRTRIGITVRDGPTDGRWYVTHCPQSKLPEPWRDNDIRSLIE